VCGATGSLAWLLVRMRRRPRAFLGAGGKLGEGVPDAVGGPVQDVSDLAVVNRLAQDEGEDGADAPN